MSVSSRSITRLDANQADFEQRLSQLLAWDSVADDSVTSTVDKIVTAIKSRGDQALLEYTNRFDRMDATTMTELVMDKARVEQSLSMISAEQQAALETAAERIHRYHQHQKQDSWSYTEADGTVLGQQITARWKKWVFMCPAAKRLIHRRY